MHRHETAYDWQAKAGALLGGFYGEGAATKAFKNNRNFVRGDAGSCICHLNELAAQRIAADED